jgi:hypothetical protein
VSIFSVFSWKEELKVHVHSGPDCERSCSIGRGVHVVLQPYCPVLQDRRHQVREEPSEGHPTDTRTAEYDPMGLHDPQQGHSLFSRMNVI